MKIGLNKEILLFSAIMLFVLFGLSKVEPVHIFIWQLCLRFLLNALNSDGVLSNSIEVAM